MEHYALLKTTHSMQACPNNIFWRLYLHLNILTVNINHLKWVLLSSLFTQLVPHSVKFFQQRRVSQIWYRNQFETGRGIEPINTKTLMK